MDETGKVDREFFEGQIASRLGAPRDDIAIGPTYGVDFGLLDIDDSVLAVATDPISILPELGFERAGRFGIRIVLSDVAVSGLTPSHVAVSLSLPPETTDEQFARFWSAIDEECRDLGVGVLTGHTARYDESRYPWVGNGTAFAVGDADDLVRPDGARPGDDLLITKGPAVETTGLLASLFPEQIDLPAETVTTAQERLDDVETVRDCAAASEAGRVTAMHDATEGGLVGALHEVAGSAGVHLDVQTDAVPMLPGVKAVSNALSMDPWRASTAGTLLLTVDPEDTDAVVSALEDRGTPVGVAGRVEDGSGVVVDGEAVDAPSGDASWPVYERLLGE
ncbi:Hydrogenase maturation factor [Natronoarchaeum philippinense]|uniref:Hydrogenase maturation factor n=1 Tax=Natronoarchaeum philippinense TaxID=558529 RepID=A0A285N705_NATPI|nr:AIR synthase family protein [Natronoarchaeum philippinense]SNZ05264.1 Hydrogenase maturation factor [Natronoarchaeum philippinense]